MRDAKKTVLSQSMYKAMNRPRPARIEISNDIIRSFRVIKRIREYVSIPVRRRSAEAAPHTTFPEPLELIPIEPRKSQLPGHKIMLAQGGSHYHDLKNRVSITLSTRRLKSPCRIMQKHPEKTRKHECQLEHKMPTISWPLMGPNTRIATAHPEVSILESVS